jgi:hypothetical protein
VEANRVTVEVGFHPFDSGDIRRIIYKMEDTGYITAKELMELEKAGLRKLKDREKFLTRPLRFRQKEYVRRDVFDSNTTSRTQSENVRSTRHSSPNPNLFDSG